MKVLLVLFFVLLFSVQGLAGDWVNRIELIKVNLYFFDNNFEAQKVPFLLETESPSKESIVEKIVNQILEGPPEPLLSFIPEGTTLNHVVFLGETVVLDFSEELQNYGGGSFNVMKIREQFGALYQIPFVKDIVFTVEGRGEIDGVLQP